MSYRAIAQPPTLLVPNLSTHPSSHPLSLPPPLIPALTQPAGDFHVRMESVHPTFTSDSPIQLLNTPDPHPCLHPPCWSPSTSSSSSYIPLLTGLGPHSSHHLPTPPFIVSTSVWPNPGPAWGHQDELTRSFPTEASSLVGAPSIPPFPPSGALPFFPCPLARL